MDRPGPAPVIIAGALMAVSAAISAVDAVIVRFVAPDMHVFQIMFFRNLFGLVVLMPFLVRSTGLGLTSLYWPTHLLRAAVKLGAMIAYFFAILELPLAVVMALAFTAPMFTTVGGIFFLGEKATATRLLSILAGLGGVFIILRPGVVPLDTGAILALASAAGLGVVALLMKLSTGREAGGRIVWMNLVLVVPMGFVLALPVWSTPSAPVLGLLVVQGVLGAIAQMAVARAMGLADAAAIIPVDFLRLPIVILLGALFFAEIPGWPVYLGSAIIFIGILVQLRAERGNGRRP